MSARDLINQHGSASSVPGACLRDPTCMPGGGPGTACELKHAIAVRLSPPMATGEKPV
jgi:hypothetical protein